MSSVAPRDIVRIGKMALADHIDQLVSRRSGMTELALAKSLFGRAGYQQSGQGNHDVILSSVRPRGLNHARRGQRSESLFSYVDLEARVGKDHPPRTIRAIATQEQPRASF